MRRTSVWVVAASLLGVVAATRWPFRSHALFSWDSANFALALLRIDIAAHRPHPPGYLGYVFAGRALNLVFHDANTALVAWNILATALAAIVLAIFTWQSAGPERRTLAALGSTTVLLTSPLLWFYGEVAEIYPSELLVALLIAYTGWRAIRGDDRAMYWCVAALAVASIFKVVTAVLMTPVAIYAWTRVSPVCRRRSLVSVAIVLGAVGLSVLIAQPHLLAVVSNVFTSTSWLFRGDRITPLRALNRNIRDTLTAAGAGLGLINAGALVVWVAFDRRLPPTVNRVLAVVWLIPYLFLNILVQIAKPGYLLPVLPLAALVLGDFYARRRRGAAVALIAIQALVNTGHFLLLTPASVATRGAPVPYGDKTVLQRAASDLDALTFPTVFTISQSDARVRELLSFVATTCPERNSIVIAGTAPVDWRRVMWYLPSATAIRENQGAFDLVARGTESAPLPPDGLVIHTQCPVVWLAPDEGLGGVEPPNMPAVTVPHLGWMTAPGTMRVTRSAVDRLP